MLRFALSLLISLFAATSAMAEIPSLAAPAVDNRRVNGGYDFGPDVNDPYTARNNRGFSDRNVGNYNPLWGAYRHARSPEGLMGSSFQTDILEIFTSNDGSFSERFLDFFKVNFLGSTLKRIQGMLGMITSNQNDRLAQMQAIFERRQQQSRLLRSGGRVLSLPCEAYASFRRSPYDMRDIFQGSSPQRPSSQSGAPGVLADHCPEGSASDYYAEPARRAPQGNCNHPTVRACVGDESAYCKRMRSMYCN